VLGRSEVPGFEGRVGEAERCPVEHVLGQAKVGGPEAGCASDRAPAVIQCTVFRAFALRSVVIGTAEDPLLPPRPVTTGESCQATVARPGLELGPVGQVAGKLLDHAHPVEPAVGVEVQGDPQPTVRWPSAAALGHVGDRGRGPLAPVGHRPILAELGSALKPHKWVVSRSQCGAP